MKAPNKRLFDIICTAFFFYKLYLTYKILFSTVNKYLSDARNFQKVFKTKSRRKYLTHNLPQYDLLKVSLHKMIYYKIKMTLQAKLQRKELAFFVNEL